MEKATPIKFNNLSKIEFIILICSLYFAFAMGLGTPCVYFGLMKLVNESIIASANTISTILSCIIVYISAHYTMKKIQFKLFKLFTILIDFIMLLLTIYFPGVVVYWLFSVVAKTITQFDSTTEGTIMLNFFPNHKRRVDFDITERKFSIICSLIGSIIAIYCDLALSSAMIILVSAYTIVNIKDIFMGSKFL